MLNNILLIIQKTFHKQLFQIWFIVVIWSLMNLADTHTFGTHGIWCVSVCEDNLKSEHIENGLIGWLGKNGKTTCY